MFPQAPVQTFVHMVRAFAGLLLETDHPRAMKPTTADNGCPHRSRTTDIDEGAPTPQKKFRSIQDQEGGVASFHRSAG